VTAANDQTNAVVCDDVEVAADFVDRGVPVVLVGDDAAALSGMVEMLRGRPARVAVMVGDPAQPTVLETALNMAAELFGGQPTVVRSRSDARQPEAGSGSVDAPTNS
jgi:hypothetical protein